MSTLYTVQQKNVQKTWLLMTMFFALVFAVGYVLAQYYSNPIFLPIFLVISILMNFISYWYSDKIVLSISGAKPADHDTYTDLYHIVENLSITAGLPMPKIYVIPDPAPNAFATGRDEKHSAVAVTDGLLALLSKNELEGVIAHELSHVKNRDILLQTVVVTLVGLLVLVSDFFARSTLFGGFGGRKSGDREGGAGNIMAIVGLVLIVLSPIIAKLIQLAVSRKREFLADASGALLTRYPAGLASALGKISKYSAPMQRANNATAHMYISSPFGAGAMKGMAKLFMTHPPVEERIQALMGSTGVEAFKY